MEQFLCKFRPEAAPLTQTVGGRVVFSAAYENGSLRLGFAYDVNDALLPLEAVCAPTDDIALEVRPYRVSLRVNGNLADENWPWGKPLYDLSRLSALHAEEIAPENLPEQPAVTREFTGWRDMCLPGVSVGDCMPFSDAEDGCETFHLYWLYDRRHHGSKWGLGAHQWAHCSTKDLKHWQEHPMAVGITDPMEGSICTGSVIRKGDRWYAWYAQRMSDWSPARLTCAISRDGVHYEKQPGFFTMPEGYEPTSARDPKVVYWDGQYHMIVTTTELATGKGCLAHFVSRDMERWDDAGVLLRGNDNAQPECPDWFQWNGKFYLLGGIHGTAYYMVSDQPFAGFVMPTPEELPTYSIPCGRVPKSAMLGNRRIFLGFVADVTTYGGPLIGVEAFQEPDGLLRFVPLDLE